MTEKFTSPLFVRCPPSMTELIEKVAESQFTTVSEYVRGAVVDRLTVDIEAATHTECLEDEECR